MWSKTKKILNDRLAPSLKKKVSYNFEVFSTRRTHVKKGKGMNKWWSESSVFSICVDKEKWYVCNNWDGAFIAYSEIIEKLALQPSDEGYWDGYKKIRKEMELEYGKETGKFSLNLTMKSIGEFLSNTNISEAIVSDNYMIRLLAVLDRRVGKRTLLKIKEQIDDEPEWYQDWIKLRLQAEGLLEENI